MARSPRQRSASRPCPCSPGGGRAPRSCRGSAPCCRPSPGDVNVLTRTIYQVEARKMAELELAAGRIEYEDTGGDGPVLLFQHGLAMGGSEWRDVVADLRADHRCVVPELPLGSHRRPMRADADLSFDGLTALVLEL